MVGFWAISSGIGRLRKSICRTGHSKIIHQSWQSRDALPGHLIPAAESWKLKNPTYTWRFWSDKEIVPFVSDTWPKYWELYRKLPKLIMQMDFFRYLVVLHYGGIWSDIDTNCLRPVDQWIPSILDQQRKHDSNTSSANLLKISAIVGVELDASDVIVDWFSNRLQFTQWTFGFSPGHPLLQHVVDTIYEKYIGMTSEEINQYSVHQVTGPTIWTDAVLDFFRLASGTINYHQFRYLAHPYVIGDVAVMPVTAFSPGNIGMGGKSVSHPDSLVEHLYYGSWKH